MKGSKEESKSVQTILCEDLPEEGLGRKEEEKQRTAAKCGN